MTRNNTHSSNSIPSVHAFYRDGCVQCSFLDAAASSCVIITLNKSQKDSNKGVTSIEVFNFTRMEKKAHGCINKSISDFDIIVFTFDKILLRIKGPGVAVELPVDQTTTGTTITTATSKIANCIFIM